MDNQNQPLQSIPSNPIMPANKSSGYYGKRNWMKWLVIYFVIAILIYGGAYFVLSRKTSKPYSVNNPHPTITIQPTISSRKPTGGKEPFSCLPLGGNQRLVKGQPYQSGVLVFKAKEGTSEETILKETKKLGYDLQSVSSAWGYSGIDTSTLFVKHSLTPDEAEELIKPIVDKYGLQERGTGFYYSSAHIFFKRLLDTNEQEDINKQLSNLKSQGKVTEFSWNIATKQLYGFLAAPPGREEEYIEKLYKLEIFDCVSRALNIIPL